MLVKKAGPFYLPKRMSSKKNKLMETQGHDRNPKATQEVFVVIKVPFTNRPGTKYEVSNAVSFVT